MDPSYTDLADDWALVRAKFDQLDRNLANELIETQQQIGQWAKDGENDRIRALADPLRDRIRASDGPRKAALEMVLFLVENIVFQVDDPEDPAEDFATRAWRTVQHGFTVMDRRHAADPSLRIFPRQEWQLLFAGEGPDLRVSGARPWVDPGPQTPKSPDAETPGSSSWGRGLLLPGLGLMPLGWIDVGVDRAGIPRRDKRWLSQLPPKERLSALGPRHAVGTSVLCLIVV